MPLYRVDNAEVRDRTTGQLIQGLVGQQVQIVLRDTVTPIEILDETSSTIPDSMLIVTNTFTVPTFWIDTEAPADLYIDWLDSSGARGPVNFEKVLRDSAAASATSSATSATAALASATSATAAADEVAALREWVNKGVTTRNVVTDPRATNSSLWTGIIAGSGVASETMVTGAADGPVLPDGTRVTTYARYTIETPGTGNGIFGYDAPSGALPVVPAGKSLAVAIYVRSSLAATSISVRKEGWLASVSAGAVQSGPSSSLPANTWQRRAMVAVNNGDFDECRVAAQFSSANQTAGQIVDVVCALLVVDATSVPDHFDGDTPSTSLVGYAWSGVRNDSVSEKIDMSTLVRSIKVSGSTLLPDASGNVDLGTLGGGGTTDHSALANLDKGDPHPQYLTPARGNSAFYPRATVDAMVTAAALQTSAADRDRSNHTGTQGIGSIQGLQEALDAAGGGAAGPDVPRLVVVATGDEPRPEGAVVVQWYDGRDPSTPAPVNMGATDIRILGGFASSADLIAPSVPTGLTTGSITASSLTLTWTASTDNVGVTGYEVRRDGSVSYGVEPGTSRAITGLSQSTTYSFQVRARDAAGNWSAWSTAAEVTTTASSDTTAPTVPTGLASSSITGSGFTVTWGAGTDNVGVTGYDVRVNGGAPTTVPADPRSRTFTDLAAETAYTIGIRSRDAAGNTSAYVDLVVTTGEADAVLYDVFGDGTPPGTYTWGPDGTPYIVVGQGFRCTAVGARAVGGRVWIPTAASGSLPTEATFYLFGPNQGLETTPVQTKVVSTGGVVAGSWVEAIFDTPQAMGSTEVWMIGVRFTGTGDAGKYPFGSGVRASGSAVPSVGPLGEDLGWIEYGTALNSAHRIGTGSVTAAASNDQARGVDILVDLGA